jgi:transposase
MSKDRTRSVNAHNALVRGNDLGIDARQKLTDAQINEVSKWRSREEELSLSIARAEAVRLAKHVLALDEQLTANENQLDDLVKASDAAPLLEEMGFRAIGAAKCLAAWSHEGRVRNEAAFASLAGVNPIPASSGNTVRHRLNRGGDRSLNSALHMVTIVRMTMTAKPASTWRSDAPRVVRTRKSVVASNATWPAASTARSARRQ